MDSSLTAPALKHMLRLLGQRILWSIDNVLTDSSDPTGSTQQDNFIGVYFDKQTGMLTQLTNLQQYNNPRYNVLITLATY